MFVCHVFSIVVVKHFKLQITQGQDCLHSCLVYKVTDLKFDTILYRPVCYRSAHVDDTKFGSQRAPMVSLPICQASVDLELQASIEQ